MDRKWTLRSVLIALAAFVLIQGAYFTFTDTPVAAQRATQAQPQSSSGGFLAGQILVQFQPGVRASVQAAIHRTQRATVRRVIRGIDVRVVRVPRGSEQAKVAAYARNPNVLYAELDYLHQPLNDPNDTDFNLKWDLHNDGQLCSAPRADCATQDADIDWQEAYEELADTTLREVIIAVVDTGADLTHPDLAGKLIAGWDFAGDDADPSDTDGHGTHTAGIAAAMTENGVGTASVAFSGTTSILPLRVCLPEGCPVSATSEAYIFAADAGGARVISISLGGLSRSRTEASAVKYAWNHGSVAGGFGRQPG